MSSPDSPLFQDFSDPLLRGLDRGPIDQEDMYAILIPAEEAAAFVYDGQPLGLNFPPNLVGIEEPLPNQGSTRRIIARFTDNLFVEGASLSMPNDSKSLAVHALEVQFRRERWWRRTSGLVRIDIDTNPPERDYLLDKSAQL